MNCTADLTNLINDGEYFLDFDRLNLTPRSMASLYVHDDHQAALEIGGVVGSSEGLVVGRNVASVGHGGKTDVKVVKDADETEAAQKGGVFELDREKTRDPRLEVVCV